MWWVSLLLLLGVAAPVAAMGPCRPCTFAGGSLAARCVPSGGILGFNSFFPPNVPAYWILFADDRGLESLRRLSGRLDAWADYTVGRPEAPGFPATCEPEENGDAFCFGTPGAFEGTVRRNRVSGTARYPDGAECQFRFRLAFGLGGERRNRFTCRDAAGSVLSRGRLRVQILRVTGCRR